MAIRRLLRILWAETRGKASTPSAEMKLKETIRLAGSGKASGVVVLFLMALLFGLRGERKSEGAIGKRGE